METVTQLIAWFTANQESLLTVAQYVFGIATIITGLTKSNSDNEWLDKLKNILGFFSVVTPRDAKNTFKLPLSKK